MTVLFQRVQKWAKATSICVLLLAATAPISQAKPATRRAPQSAQPAANIYDRAKAELPEDVYTLYRIVERVARANQLDQRPWRVGIVPTYDINAFATQVNLVALHDGLLDQLSGDSSAIACVVAHEMAHHEKRHIALGQAQRQQITEQAVQEAKAEVEREVNSARTESTATGVLGTVLGNVGGLPGLGGQILTNQSQNRRNRAQQRVQEIAEKKKAELEANLAASVRKQEFEADEVGYLMATRAGFEAEGCLRAMAVLARTPGAEFDTTHPAVPKRIEALQQLMKKYPPATLAAEGKAKLAATQPLTYDLSRDGKSLRINSRFGGSSDIDRVLGR
ncbi:peptidase M48, Ste24p [Leptolyngbya sp. NIES-3755]|nr:peptidase M48, Ste24p [Leptolyngbya sp. NIES-3755]